MRGRSSSSSSSSSSTSTSSSSSSSSQSSGSSHGRPHHRHGRHHHGKEMKRFHKMREHHFKHLMGCRGMGPYPFRPGHHFGPHAARMMHHHPHPFQFGDRTGFHASPRTGDQFENMQSQMEILRINMNRPGGQCAGKHMKHLHKRMGKMHKNYKQYNSFDKRSQKKEDNYLIKLEKKAKKLQKKMDKLEQKRQYHLMLLGLQLDMHEDATSGNREESSQRENNVEFQQTPQREDTAAPVEAN